MNHEGARHRTTPNATPGFAPGERPPLAGSSTRTWALFARLHLLELLAALSTLGLASWQLLRLDSRYFGGFVIFWMLPPVIAMAIHVRAPRLTFLNAWAGIYLALLCLGALVASNPTWLPHFQALHPADTEFAARWNRLSLESRRMFSWNMALGGASMFFFAGWQFWTGLRDHRRYGRSHLSPAVCALGLLAAWVLPGMALAYFVLSLFAPRG